MNPEDLLRLAVFVVVVVLVLGHMIRSARRFSRARPPLSEPPRRIVMPPRAARVPGPIAPPKRAAAPKRRPAPTLDERILRNPRLSPGARLIVASEILSGPKALRRRRPL